MRYTTRHADKAVIKNKDFLPEAMDKLAKYEDVEETGCSGCQFQLYTKTLYPCRFCVRGKEDKYKGVK